MKIKRKSDISESDFYTSKREYAEKKAEFDESYI